MKNSSNLNKLIYFLAFTLSLSVSAQKLKSTKTHISFFSTTPVEDISANNYKTVSTIDIVTGKIVFVVPMQSFEFEKSLMQKHFNNKKFLNTKANPKGKLVGNIKDLSAVNFKNDGVYNVVVKGDMTINGTTNSIEEPAVINIKNGKAKLDSKFNIVLADYGVVFEKGKPSRNIAKNVEIKVVAEY